METTIIIISAIAYEVVGLAYINAIPNLKVKFDWILTILFSPFWPYVMLNRFFQHRVYMADQKRAKAHREALGE